MVLRIGYMTDTGASTSSFARADVIDSSPRLMEMVQFEKTKVILGNGDDRTAVRCSGVIYLDIDFIDDEGAIIQSVKKIKCIIMPTLSVDVIIGWPDIVRKIPKIFIKGFVAALNEAHSGANLTCSICTEVKKPKPTNI